MKGDVNMSTELMPWRNRLSSSIEQMRRDLDEALGNWFSDSGSGDGMRTAFTPQTNISETSNQYEVTVDLPGMKPEEVKVEVVGDRLVISGERKQETETKDKTWHRIEQSHGMFRRSFQLGQPIEAGGINARFTNGVLTVTVPKSESALPQQIPVQEG